MAGLSTAEIDSALVELPGWTRVGEGEGKGEEAMAFVNAVADIARQARHHPEILIRYNRVRLTLTTHEAGGVTGKDLDFARAVAVLVQSLER